MEASFSSEEKKSLKRGLSGIGSAQADNSNGSSTLEEELEISEEVDSTELSSEVFDSEDFDSEDFDSEVTDSLVEDEELEEEDGAGLLQPVSVPPMSPTKKVMDR